MEDNKVMDNDTFDKLDEAQLVLVLNQVARRMMVLRCTTPDVAFWHGIIMRVGKWLGSEPIVNSREKEYLLSPPASTSGRMRAIRSLRERTGAGLMACKNIVDDWIKENLDLVDATVRASFLSSEKNRTDVSL